MTLFSLQSSTIFLTSISEPIWLGLTIIAFIALARIARSNLLGLVVVRSSPMIRALLSVWLKISLKPAKSSSSIGSST